MKNDENITQNKKAFNDLKNGFSMWRLWAFIGWDDIKKRYRRSILGPFWITLSTGVTVGGLGIIYSTIFKIDIDVYLPYLGMGFVVWFYLNMLINDGANTFIKSSIIIKQLSIPHSVHMWITIWKNTIIFLHNMIIYLVILLIFKMDIGLDVFLAIPGILILTIFCYSTGLILAIICLRYRDVPQIITSIMQLAFFLTPVIWMTESFKERAWVVIYNPFYHFISIVRGPLIGRETEILNWFVAIGITFSTTIIAYLFFVKYRSRIPFWV